MAKYLRKGIRDMKAINVLFATLLFAMLSTTALAQDGNELLRWCENSLSDEKIISSGVSSAFNAGLCLGMMQGITNLNVFYEQTKKSLFCLPSSIKNEQAARIVINYLNEHPEKLDQDGTLLAILAFVKAFPCKKRSRL